MSRVHPLITQLIRARNARNWSVEKVAARSGIPASTIRSWEAGTYLPSLRNYIDWAQTLGMELQLVPIGEAERSLPSQSRADPPEVTRQRRRELVEAMGRPDGDVAPCGTSDARRRHVAHGEECEVCAAVAVQSSGTHAEAVRQ